MSKSQDYIKRLFTYGGSKNKNDDVFIYRSNYEIYKAGFDNVTNPVNGTKDQIYVNTIFVSNFKCNQLFNHRFPEKKYDELYKDKEPVYAELIDGTKILTIDKNTNIPIDYDKEMLVPITILYYHFKQHFDVTQFQQKKTVVKFSDRKSRYVRILVKWKNINNK